MTLCKYSIYPVLLTLLLNTWTIAQESDEAEAPEADKKEKWKVNQPPYQTRAVDINVNNGTWMSVDVSPDGQQIVFDLLGDIYLLPINGGDARALTSTIAWDMQPRFSPDGKHIAFTSDQGGGDNIWIMDSNGDNPRAISEEKFRLLNNPAWSPDGRFIVGRKHFTSTRSLGAGELWLYNIDGGKGVQMNERPNEQKDLGEPIFSADGRYVYFSQDITPGPVFEYNKDSNGVIYGIKRLDTRTGDIDNIINNPGGSVRPTPSPDGKYLAFVKRVRNETGLFIKDLRSGAEELLCLCLDRDMQETWAIHGVYPNIAWTPNSDSLVFWAAGKLHKLNVNTKQRADIPFQINHQRQVAEAVRFQNPAFRDTEHTKMLRWAQVSPDGEKVVFQTLGQLYVRDLTNDRLRQITDNTNETALYPSISPDGRWVVYVSWNDQELGRVKKVRINGGNSRTVVEEPGHYIEPVFDHTGNNIVYQKLRGSELRGPDWGLNPGVYRIDADGRQSPEKLPFNGRLVHFNQAGQLFFTDADGAGTKRQFKLMLWDDDTAQAIEVAHTTFGTEFKISPDGNWIAFIEGFNVYVTPFQLSGRPITLSGSGGALPVKKVSSDAGEYIHWSSDSTILYWSLGPQLFQQTVDRELLAQKNSEDKKDQTEDLEKIQGRDIGFDFAGAKPKQVVALTGARIITVNASDEVINNGVIVIRDNRIESLGPSGSLRIPDNALTIDLAGRTVMPGLIDVHWHGSQGQSEIIPQQNWNNLATLAFGVTTLHDPSNDTSTIFAASEMAKAGLIPAPRIFSTGTILYGAQDVVIAEVDSLDDARRHIKRMKAAGAFSVKSYNQPRRDQRQQILTAAIEEEILVMPEGASLFQHNMNMIVDGHTGIEHAIPVANIYDDVKQLWSATKVGYTPTLVVAYGGIWGENYWYQQSDVWRHPLLSHWVPPNVLQPRSVRRLMAPREDFNHFASASIVKQLSDLGVDTHIGAHGQREGLGAHWELWMFAQGGMSPLQAIRSATYEGAEYLGMEKDIGSIEVGKLADFAILDSNPLQDIYSSDKVYAVMINGRLFLSASLEELKTGNWKPKPMYWH